MLDAIMIEYCVYVHLKIVPAFSFARELLVLVLTVPVLSLAVLMLVLPLLGLVLPLFRFDQPRAVRRVFGATRGLGSPLEPFGAAGFDCSVSAANAGRSLASTTGGREKTVIAGLIEISRTGACMD